MAYELGKAELCSMLSAERDKWLVHGVTFINSGIGYVNTYSITIAGYCIVGVAHITTTGWCLA